MNKTYSKWILRLLCAGLVLTLALSRAVLVRGAGTGTIRIGDTTFAPEDAVSSGWTNGKGWKNLPGKYVALVDYQGQGKEVSRDGGELTLAVAGVNRIGTLKGDCSVNIVGTGIVLIDSIEIEEGNTISLMTDKAQYEEGSAAVFVKEGDDYVLINGSIPGILDEDYTLDGVSLIVPKDSSLIFSATGIRTETWYDESGPKTKVTEYTTTIPIEATYPEHEGGEVTFTGHAARLTLKSGSTLTVAEGASVVMEEVKKETSLATEIITPKLVIEGTLDITGSAEGGVVEVASGGSLGGSGTFSSAEVDLPPGANLSSTLLLDRKRKYEHFRKDQQLHHLSERNRYHPAKFNRLGHLQDRR